MTKKISKALWDESIRLSCPCLRWNKGFATWVALREDPCPTKRCKLSKCKNFGKPNIQPERLMIINIEEEQII